MRLRQLLSARALLRVPDMRTTLPLRALAPPTCRAPAAAPPPPRHAAARLLAASSFCPGSRALLHATARPSTAVARTAVAPGKTRAQASSFQDAGLGPELLEAVRALRCAGARAGRVRTRLTPLSRGRRRRRRRLA
jgi:hypothetical protein